MTKNKEFRVEVYFQGELTVTVKARNARQAWGKAAKRVKKRNIGNNLRRDFSVVENTETGDTY